MTVYLHPNLKSKKAFKERIAEGGIVTAVQKTPSGDHDLTTGKHAFSGPHYPEPHRFYGQATLENGKVVKVV